MGKEVYVGNLSFGTTEDTLKEAFAQFGTVESVNIITDHETGRNRGFAFVKMAQDEEAKAAIAGLEGKEIDGRTLKVNEARQREYAGGGGGKRPGGGGGGRGGYGNRGGSRY